MLSTRIRGVSPDKTDWRKSKTEEPCDSLILSYSHQKYQTGKADPSGFLFAYPTRGRRYNVVPDNADEVSSPFGPLTLRVTLPNNANETKLPLASPSTLPEYAVEVEIPC